MSSVLNEESVEKKLRTVSNTQDSIQTLSLWIIHHKSNHAKIVELWMKVLKHTAQPGHRLTLFYLCNDVVQNCKKKKAFVYNTTFKECLREAAALVRDGSVKNKVERIFNIWRERGVYDAAFISSLHSILNGQNVKSYPTAVSAKEESSKSRSHTPKTPPAAPERTEEQVQQHVELDPEESARILAEFKPHEMIEQITAYLRQEVEIKARVSQLSHLKLDISVAEAMKQLKDRTHGNSFSNQIEDTCTKLEELIKRQNNHMADHRTLLETLTLSETFYEEQYREAKIVANAYRNFGARINNMKKKLDELKKTLPEPELDSPISSPDLNAPSPPTSPPPPHLSKSDHMYSPDAALTYDLREQQLAPYAGPAWLYGTATETSLVNTLQHDSNSFQGTPPLEAPSPEGSPLGLNIEATDNVSSSLESRIANFFNRGQSEVSTPPPYTPQLSRPVATIDSRTNQNEEEIEEDDAGSTTPLDDEMPTTPVQDEHFTSPPKRIISPPPKKEKENPIDFLSRLISQTQKAPVKTETQNFLDSLTMLTMPGNKASVDSQQLPLIPASKPWASGDSQQPPLLATPQPWEQWKLNLNENSMSPSQPSSPSSFAPGNSVPPSPIPFSTVIPMVAPPLPLPIPPPVPPNVAGISAPPLPPQFVLTAPLIPDLKSAVSMFQQTSPGQKENWPERRLSQSTDQSSAVRTTHNSVLKELIPTDTEATKPGLRDDDDLVELVNDDINDSMSGEEAMDIDTRLESNHTGSASFGVLKSHAFMPNPVRPNLMTLTGTDEQSDKGVNSKDSVTQDGPTWPESSNISRLNSQSRSPVREQNSVYQRQNSREWSQSEENSGIITGDSQPISSICNTSQNIQHQIFRSNRDDFNPDKFNGRFPHNDHWQQGPRKFNQFEPRGFPPSGGNMRPLRNRGPEDVEAYSQAYKMAFIQQYNRPPLQPFIQQFNRPAFRPFMMRPSRPPMDPRMSGFRQF